jgi:hypothetical protein
MARQLRRALFRMTWNLGVDVREIQKMGWDI